MLLLYHMITLLLFWSNAVWRNHDQMSWSEIVTLLFFHPWLKSYPIKEPVLLATTLWISGSLGVFRYLKYCGQIKSFINDIFPTRRTRCLNFILVCFHQPPSAPSIFCFLTDSLKQTSTNKQMYFYVSLFFFRYANMKGKLQNSIYNVESSSNLKNDGFSNFWRNWKIGKWQICNFSNLFRGLERFS